MSMKGGKFKRDTQAVNNSNEERTNNAISEVKANTNNTLPHEKSGGHEVETINNSSDMIVVATATKADSSAEPKNAIYTTSNQVGVGLTDTPIRKLNTNKPSNIKSGDIMLACGFNNNDNSQRIIVEASSVEPPASDVPEHRTSELTTDQRKGNGKGYENKKQKVNKNGKKNDWVIQRMERNTIGSPIATGSGRQGKKGFSYTGASFRPEHHKDVHVKTKRPQYTRPGCRSTPRSQQSATTPAFNNRCKSPLRHHRNYQQAQSVGRFNCHDNTYNVHTGNTFTRY
jgi:hypothetical protein